MRQYNYVREELPLIRILLIYTEKFQHRVELTTFIPLIIFSLSYGLNSVRPKL